MVGAQALGRAGIAGATLAAVALALPAAAPAFRTSTGAQPSAVSVHVTDLHLSAVWNEGWLTASVHFSLVTSGAASVAALARPVAPGPTAARATYSLTKAGTYPESLELPARLLPKEYDLTVNGTVGGHFTVPTPPEGVVDIATISAAKGGKATRLLTNVHELWVRFHFLVPPAAKSVQVVWRTPSYTFVGAVTKPYATTIDSFVSSASPLPDGTWYAILMVDGKTAKKQDVKVS